MMKGATSIFDIQNLLFDIKNNPLSAGGEERVDQRSAVGVSLHDS